jgi:hypothetical protein
MDPPINNGSISGRLASEDWVETAKACTGAICRA